MKNREQILWVACLAAIYAGEQHWAWAMRWGAEEVAIQVLLMYVGYAGIARLGKVLAIYYAFVAGIFVLGKFVRSSEFNLSVHWSAWLMVYNWHRGLLKRMPLARSPVDLIWPVCLAVQVWVVWRWVVKWGSEKTRARMAMGGICAAVASMIFCEWRGVGRASEYLTFSGMLPMAIGAYVAANRGNVSARREAAVVLLAGGWFLLGNSYFGNADGDLLIMLTRDVMAAGIFLGWVWWAGLIDTEMEKVGAKGNFVG